MFTKHKLTTTSTHPVKTKNISLSSKSAQTAPILRKNRKVENKWGLRYQIAVQYAAFGRQCFPYMPTEPPASLSEEIVESEPLYVCKECKDCFRFQSSFKDHNERRSWIFGLWCHSCYRTVCNHIVELDSVCSICIKKVNVKRSYLRSRGLKTYKVGAIKVFYNQCQLLEHMKMHGLCSIDMTDVMLMPIPTDMSNSNWSSELEIACEALMEYTFLLNVHIMDWLRKNKLENTWWKLANNIDENDDNQISQIIKGYRGRQIFNNLEDSMEDLDLNSADAVHNVDKNFPDIEFIDTEKDKIENNNSSNMTSDKNMSENEDNPCMSTDIAFVDCGPISRYLEPESSVSTSILKNCATNAKKSAKIRKTNNKRKKSLFVKHIIRGNTAERTNGKNLSNNMIGKTSSKRSAQRYRITQSSKKKSTGNSISKPIIENDVGKILDNVVTGNIPFTTKRFKLRKASSDFVEQDLRSSIANCNSKILTVQGPKDADITSIINNLPPQLISNNKKLVLLGQDSHGLVSFNSKNEVIIEKKLNKLISGISNTDTNRLSQEKTCNPVMKQEVAGKIMIKNGKKYLIKHQQKLANVTNSENSSNLPVAINVSQTIKRLPTERNTSTSINTDEVESIDVEQVALHNDILTPSPSPSELSSSSSSESHMKQAMTKIWKIPPQLISLDSTQKNLFETISLIKEKNGETYMNIKLVDRISKEVSHNISENISKYKQEMIDDFGLLNRFELKKRIDHLQRVNEEGHEVMNFISDDVLKEKLKSIVTLRCILEESFNKCNQVGQNENDDAILNEWELESKKEDLQNKCPSCDKIIKPKYIAGFSRLPKDDNIYCLCYKYICHKCLSYHGGMSRFIAHQNFHKKVEPFICPDCHCKFSSIKFLEIHMWTICFHTLKKLCFACKICDIDGFRDIESITRHFAVMHSVTKVVCEDCFKVFSLYKEYMEHYVNMHPFIPKQNPIRLVICKLDGEIVRCENYMSYLEKHPAIRKIIWFKCPFCPLIITENKQTTTMINNHLREKHRHRLSEVLSKEALANILVTEFAETSGNTADTFVNVNDASCEDGTVVPKIVNTRTITSEIFERDSHDKSDTWSNFDVSELNTITAGANAQIPKKVDDREELHSFPKILSVRSMAELKGIESEAIITDTSTETNRKQSSQSDVVEIAKENLVENEERMAMKLSNSFLEEKEFDKSNNVSVASCVSESERFPSFLSRTDDLHANSSIESNKKILDPQSVPKVNTDGRIKVVDFRKICKPDIKPFIATELCDTRLENQDANDMGSILNPPPLAKMPGHFRESGNTGEPNKVSRNVAKSKSLPRKLANRPKQRIAIGQPAGTQQECVEFRCHLCGDGINISWPVVRKHFFEKHMREYQLAVITPRLLRLSPDFITDGYRQVIGNKKRKSDTVLFSSKRKRRWTPKKHTEAKDGSIPDIGLCVEQETAEDGEGNFKCKKCDQRCTDMSNLREHIAANHRLKGRYLICLECGENFVVAPSLQMHLKAFHGIEDPITYMSQNPSYAPDLDGDLETEARTTVANQCYVCMAVFENKATVDKHLRVHGMAFLNRKRIEARNALRSPEKKTNMEENKQTLVKDNSKEIMKQDKTTKTILEKLNAMA